MVQVRDMKVHEADSVHALLAANGWAHRLGSPQAFAALIAASQRKAVAVTAQGEIVGFARAITDGLSNGYLSMVVVAPTARRQGIGRALVEQVMGSNPAITWVLRAGRTDAAAFFAGLGFAASTTAMEKPRA